MTGRQLVDLIPPPALVVAFVIIALFAYAFIHNPTDDTLKGALIAAFAGAWGYYLGSSKGAVENREQLNKQSDLLAETAATVATRAIPTETKL